MLRPRRPFPTESPQASLSIRDRIRCSQFRTEARTFMRHQFPLSGNLQNNLAPSVPRLIKFVGVPRFGQRSTVSTVGLIFPESTSFASSASSDEPPCADKYADRTPCFAASSSEGGLTIETRIPPFFRVFHERFCVSPPMGSSTTSTSCTTSSNRVFS